MQIITSPVQFQEISANVANLQTALSIMMPSIGVVDFKIPAAELAGQTALDATRDAIELIQEKFPDNYDRSLLVDKLMAKLINDFIRNWFSIKGKLTNSHQQGMAAHTILFDEYNLDAQTALGKATTNTDGSFEFGFLYSEQSRKKDGNSNPDIKFKIISPQGLELPIVHIFIITDGAEIVAERLADSAKAPFVLLNISNETIVRIVPDEIKLTEFENAVAALQPFTGETSFASLKEDDNNFQISFLSKETGIEKSTVENLKNAFIIERDNDLPAWAIFGLSMAPLPMAEWKNKTPEEFIALLNTLTPANTMEIFMGWQKN